MERIQAQLRERIQEAVEMAGARADGGACAGIMAAPRPTPTARRTAQEFEETARGLLAHRAARRFMAELRRDLAGGARASAEAARGRVRARLLAGQVFLARELPDYWQRFERYQRQYAEHRLADPGGPGWLKRLFG